MTLKTNSIGRSEQTQLEAWHKPSFVKREGSNASGKRATNAFEVRHSGHDANGNHVGFGGAAPS